MNVTETQLAERYAAMTSDDLKALDPQKLTPEAQKMRDAELKRRGIDDGPALEEARARREQALDTRRKRNYTRQLVAVALVAAAFFVEFVVTRFISMPQYALTAVIVALCVLAVYVLRGRK